MLDSARTALALALFLAVPAVAGCSGGGNDGPDAIDYSYDCTQETRSDTYVAGLEKDSTAVKVQLTSDPAPPQKGDNTWTLMVTDTGDTPLDGLTINSTPFMPDHGHGTASQETVTAGTQAGEYVLDPVNLWMPGYWEVTIDFTGTGISDKIVYKICIDG